MVYSMVAYKPKVMYAEDDRLVGGLPLHVVLALLKFAKCSKLSSLLDKFKVLV